MRSCGQCTFPVMHDALNRSLATSMMTITATVVEKLIIRWVYSGREQIKLSMVCCTCSFVLPHHNQGVFYSDTTAAKPTVPDAPGFHVKYPNKPWKME